MKQIFLVILFSAMVVFNISAHPFYVNHTAYIRAGAGKSFKELGVANKGTYLEVLEVSGSWAKIKYKNGEGFVNATFLNEVAVSDASGRNHPVRISSYIGGTVGVIVASLIIIGFIKVLFQGIKEIFTGGGSTYRGGGGGHSNASKTGIPYNQDAVNAEIKKNTDLSAGKRNLFEK